MKKYEVIEVRFDYGDLDNLNGLSSIGFRIVHVDRIAVGSDYEAPYIALMEREIPKESA